MTNHIHVEVEDWSGGYINFKNKYGISWREGIRGDWLVLPWQKPPVPGTFEAAAETAVRPAPDFRTRYGWN